MFTKRNLVIFGLLFVLILAAGLYFATLGEKQYTIEKTPAKELMAAKQAYDMAFAEAKKWQAGAQPGVFKKNRAGKEGKREAWQAEFYSKSYTEAQGGPEGSPTKFNYLVTVKNKKIENTEIAESGIWGSGLPSDWRGSPEIFAQFLAAPNFTNETIKELNLYYDRAFQKWFWAVRTEKGVTGFEIR